ncbi:hypothetical protein [Pedobacter nyackensis]|uniref:Uncharacterized protein n=1 Tax=Pedobacter nyackensis TaxID=475255 RepID=A0A1W2D9U0_9SPHI|nr:hypothetical protein [Pedobacter nyackensis]SMC93758.1 hypothetical protein SAMN04488101_10618 [Pedobacter nyackensis]
MKHKNNLWFTVLLIASVLMQSCKKDKVGISSPDTFSTNEFTYNMATKQISPDAQINAELISPAGIKLIYCYLVRNNTTDSLIYIGNPAEDSRNNYKFNIPSSSYAVAKMAQVMGVKVMVKHLDNTTFEGFIKVTSFTPPMPKLENVPVSLLPNASNIISVTGKASSENGLKLIEIYDDYQGTFVLVNKIDLSNSEKVYDLNYEYTYRKNAGNLKVVIIDKFDLRAESVINIPLKKFTLYKDVIMMAHGTAAAPSTNSFFMGKSGTLLGTCTISGKEKDLDFVTYCTTTPAFTIYGPSNTTTIAKNFKCGVQIWEPSAIDLKATKFRTLIPGTAETDKIYASYNANTITDLGDEFFTGILLPGSSSVKYDLVAAANAFNLTTAYLVWIRVPEADGSFTNMLLRAKEVIIGSSTPLSTIKFDILVSK